MSARKPWTVLPLVLALGCRGSVDTDYVDGIALVFNASERLIELTVDLLTDVDCLVLDHAGLAASLPNQDPQDWILDHEELAFPWDDALYEQDIQTCAVGRVTVEGEVATMVYDLALPYQEIPLPGTLDQLSHNTLVIDIDGPQRFNDGGQGGLATPENQPPACELPLGPSWTGRSSTGTLLAIETRDTCTVLRMSGEGNDVELCNGPALPYVVGEDLELSVEHTRFAAVTRSGGKSVLVATLATHLPANLAGMVPTDGDGRTVLQSPACVLNTPCGPAVSSELLLREDDGAFLDELAWGESTEVRLPDGATRRFSLYHAGAPAQKSCPPAMAFAIAPDTDGPE